jgi:hypothetical protein
MTPSLDTGSKLGLALVTLVVSVGLMGFSAWFGWGVVLALPLSILWWFELGAEWRQASADHPRKRLAGWLMGLPQALFGLLCTAVGMAMLGWALYNTFWTRDPAYSGGLLTFGLAPTLILFGVGLILAALRRPPPPKIYFDEPRLGRLVYRPDVSQWESADDAGLYHGGIPGDPSGPDPARIGEIIGRLQDIDRYWDACAADLLLIAGDFASLPRARDPRELYRLVAVSLHPDHWEVCFQTHDHLDKWLYVGMQFEGETLVSNTIDT